MSSGNDSAQRELRDHRWETILEMHDRAQQTAHHNDILMWQVTSIVWGANAVLMGLALGMIRDRQDWLVVLPLAVVGVVLTIFVARFFYLSKIGQRAAYEICREAERHFPDELRLHTAIHSKYDNETLRLVVCDQHVGKAQRWVYGITLLFVFAWGFVGYWAVVALTTRVN